MKVLSIATSRLIRFASVNCMFTLLALNMSAQALPELKVRPLDNKYVIAHWVMQEKSTPATFYIERSPDGEKFTLVGVVESDISAGKAFHYSFLDETPLEGPAYYRLRIVANNTAVVYTPSVSLEHGGMPTGFIPEKKNTGLYPGLEMKPKASTNHP